MRNFISKFISKKPPICNINFNFFENSSFRTNAKEVPNKDKFKSNGNFSVAVQIDDYGKGVAIPIPHSKDVGQQPSSKYIHVDSEKIDLNNLPLLIREAEVRQNMIERLRQGISKPRLVNTLAEYLQNPIIRVA